MPTKDIDLPAAGAGAPTADQRPASWDDLITAVAKQHGVSPALAKAVAKKESWFNQSAVGDGGQAVGMYQLHEGAAKDTGITDRTDPLQNVTGGVKYLRQLSDRYKGDVSKALQAYNGGMANVDKGTVTPEAQAYASSVIADLSAMARQGAGPKTAIGPTPAATPTRQSQLDSTGKPLPPPGTGGRGTHAQNIGADARSNFGNFVAAYDPRTATGRENWTATAASGGAAAIIAAQPELAPLVVRVLTPALAAGASSAVEKAVENKLGTATESPLTTGLTQGAIDLAGQAMMGILRGGARRLIGLSVASNAAEGLKAEGQAIRDRGVAAVDSARATMNDAIDMVKRAYRSVLDQTAESSAATVRGAEAAATASTRAARQKAVTALADAELANTADITAAKRALDDLGQTGLPRPSVSATAQQVKSVMEGPAKRALDIAGARVNEVAKHGPMVETTSIKNELARLAEQKRPDVVFGASSADGANAIGFGTQGSTVNARQVAQAPGQKISVEEFKRLMSGAGTTDSNPLPGLLGKLQDLPDQITFEDAHKIKMLLDESVNWDRAAKKHLEKITKGLRSEIRQVLSVYEPYNDATAAYAALVPLYRKGVGQQLIKLSGQGPAGASKVATLLKDADPVGAKTIRTLLVNQAAEGGGEAAGKKAWEAVRAAYTYNHLIDKGIESLQKNLGTLAKESPDFVREVYGDDAGQQILINLGNIADAYAQAQTMAAERTAATKAAGTAATTAARDIGAAGVAEAKDIGKATTQAAQRELEDAIAAERRKGASTINVAKRATTEAKRQQAAKVAAFEKSSVGRVRHQTAESVGADLARAAVLGPTSKWGGISMLHLLRGPKSKDLLAYAAYSPASTQMLVKILTQPGPPEAAAAFFRGAMNAIAPAADTQPGGRVPSATPAR